MQIDVIEYSLGVHIHALHQIALKDKLARLPYKEFSYCHKLIPVESLPTMLDCRRFVSETCYLEKF